MAKPQKLVTKTETIVIEIITCKRCGYRWPPDFEFDHWKKNKTDGKVKRPVTCAHCHSPYYDKARTDGAKTG